MDCRIAEAPSRSRRKLFTLAALFSLPVSLLFTLVMGELTYWRDTKIVLNLESPPAELTFRLDNRQAATGQCWIVEATVAAETPEKLTVRINGEPLALPAAARNWATERGWRAVDLPANLLHSGTNHLEIKNPSGFAGVRRLRIKNVFGYSSGFFSVLVVNRRSQKFPEWPQQPLFLACFFALVYALTLLRWRSLSRGSTRFSGGDWCAHAMPLLFLALFAVPLLSRAAVRLSATTAILLMAIHFTLLHRAWLTSHFRYAVALAMLACAGFFLFFIQHESVNAPFHDDYDNVLGIANAFSHHPGPAVCGRWLFSQHNEHRLVFNRLVVLGVQTISGAINFKTLIWIGNIGLFVLLGICFRTARLPSPKWLYFAPCVFFLLQPLFFESILWAMAALSNFWIFTFAFSSLLLLEKNRSWTAFWASLALALAAVFTQANGMLALAVSLALLLQQKRFRESAIWTAISAITIVFYFQGYVRPPSHPAIGDALLHPLHLARFFLQLVGLFQSEPAMYASALLLLGLFLFLTIRGYHRRNPALYAMLLFVYGTAAVTAVGRSGLGFVLANSPRYRIFPVLLVMLTYLALWETRPESRNDRKFLAGAIIAAILFNVIAYKRLQPVAEYRKAGIIAGLNSWQKTGRGLAYPDPQAADAILRESIQLGIYRPPWMKKTPLPDVPAGI